LKGLGSGASRVIVGEHMSTSVLKYGFWYIKKGSTGHLLEVNCCNYWRALASGVMIGEHISRSVLK
jgi:hypothetical protein